MAFREHVVRRGEVPHEKRGQAGASLSRKLQRDTQDRICALFARPSHSLPLWGILPMNRRTFSSLPEFALSSRQRRGAQPRLGWVVLLPGLLLGLVACGDPSEVDQGSEPQDDSGTGGRRNPPGGLPIDGLGTGGTGEGEEEPGSGALFTCGNGELEPGELCDDGNTEDGDGCAADCLSQDPDFDCSEEGQACRNLVVCGNGRLEGSEACDDGNTEGGDGCAADCRQVEEGYLCARPGRACLRLAVCGNGTLERGEQCDDGNAEAGDGCSAECQIESEDGWFCELTTPSVCEKSVCGDGKIAPNEQCDDSNQQAGDGCSASCQLEPGWVCPSAGQACLPRCGDGLRTGPEQCDLGASNGTGQGCTASCQVELGYSCSAQGCTRGECGNGQLEAGEGCDDGNRVAGDGCSATCQREPSVQVGPSPQVEVFCGDGLITGTEQCDDGNQISGDGCSADCQEEPGFTCSSHLEVPEFVNMRVTYRDFRADHQTNGHPDFQVGIYPPRNPNYHRDAHENRPNVSERGVVGAQCNSNNTETCGRLDEEGKPRLRLTNPQLVESEDSFSLWYRDENRFSGQAGHPLRTVRIWMEEDEEARARDFLRLERVGTTGQTFRYENRDFFPLNDRLAGNYAVNGVNCSLNRPCNFHFTTELRYFFQYQGGEKLTFLGDDDVWVFINGRLAVDIGGIHSQEWGRVLLGDDGIGQNGVRNPNDDSDCSIRNVTESRSSSEPRPNCALSAAELADNRDSRFDLEKGKVYEIALFQAERRSNHSNFILTLSGFLAPRSTCVPTCGDGIVAGFEVCDEGSQNASPGQTPAYGQCRQDCSGFSFCGDAVQQSPEEQCDDGINQSLYGSTGCAPGCVTPAFCGDGQVQTLYEDCDLGAENASGDAAYESCTTECKWGPYCGDGVKNGSELCDDGANNVPYAAQAGACGYDCEWAPHCGDGVRNGPEQCDLGAEQNTGEYGGCTEECRLAPRCGDGVVQASEGEQCDDGPQGSLSCSSTCTRRQVVTR